MSTLTKADTPGREERSGGFRNEAFPVFMFWVLPPPERTPKRMDHVSKANMLGKKGWLLYLWQGWSSSPSCGFYSATTASGYHTLGSQTDTRHSGAYVRNTTPMLFDQNVHIAHGRDIGHSPSALRNIHSAFGTLRMVDFPFRKQTLNRSGHWIDTGFSLFPRSRSVTWTPICKRLPSQRILLL